MENAGIVREEWGQSRDRMGKSEARGRVGEKVGRGGVSGEQERHGKSAGHWGLVEEGWRESR